MYEFDSFEDLLTEGNIFSLISFCVKLYPNHPLIVQREKISYENISGALHDAIIALYINSSI